MQPVCKLNKTRKELEEARKLTNRVPLQEMLARTIASWGVMGEMAYNRYTLGQFLAEISAAHTGDFDMISAEEDKVHRDFIEEKKKCGDNDKKAFSIVINGLRQAHNAGVTDANNPKEGITQ